MPTIELQLDAQTLERARQLAESRRSTLEGLLKELVEQLSAGAVGKDPVLGMFSDEPELVDEVIEAAMSAREEHPLRHTHG